ncbi:hypothetical protein IGK74_001318 [Enterococcus sp. AZ150]|uniref:helix-turn-helix domain-containing protein n=1 Tax=Enterococcus sp. AZ150 TaxID=2774866 RepID=UPI003F278853
MLQFVEASISKKIQIAEYLYVQRGEIDPVYMQKDLELSNSTFKRYVQEIEELYQAEYVNGIHYNVYALNKIIRFLVQQSAKLALLRHLVFYPGESSEFYRKKTLMAPATFARVLGQIKGDLRHFNMEILQDNGYWIKGKNEQEEIMLFAYLASLFGLDTNELKELVSEFGGQAQLAELETFDFTFYKFSNYQFEEKFFEHLYLFSLLRQFQFNQKIGVEEIVSVDVVTNLLRNGYEENELEAHQRFSHVVHTMCHDTVSYEKRELLIQLFIKTNFHLKLFPYKMRIFDLRQDFFVRKMYHTHPHRRAMIEPFMKQMSQLLNVDLFQREISIIYFLVSENILTFEQQYGFHLYVHSTLGEKHADFLVKELGPLRQFFSEPFVIKKLKDLELLDTHQDIILLTNEVFETYPTDKQYIISDYLTLTEFLQFSVWLRERTTHKLSYPA